MAKLKPILDDLFDRQETMKDGAIVDIVRIKKEDDGADIAAQLLTQGKTPEQIQAMIDEIEDS